jgi:hypothetical protein
MNEPPNTPTDTEEKTSLCIGVFGGYQRMSAVIA